MAFEFRLPDIGEGVVEGEIVKWHVKAGDQVSEDQPMVEVMTDKATVVIPSPKAGKVLEVRGEEGDIAKVDEILVIIEEAGGAAKKAAPSPAPAQAAAAPAQAKPQAAPTPAAAPPKAPAADRRPVLAAPATRRLARELKVEIGNIVGTGPGGRVTSEDVRAAGESAGTTAPTPVTITPQRIEPNFERKTLVPRTPVPLPAVDDAELAETIPVRGIRGRIWDAMMVSKHTATHFTFVEECDCSGLVQLRDRFNERRAEGEAKINYLPFIIKAVIASLRKFPDLNGHVDDENRAFVRRHDYQIGVAAATDRGLIVPVVRHADRRSILDLSSEVSRLGRAAREGTITTDDLGGSTFTITSLGKDGGIFATPIINYPEVAIMGVHKMTKRPMVDENDQIVVKPMMNLSLSFDHRLIDGHVGAAFTYSVIRLLQEPDRLLMEMS